MPQVSGSFSALPVSVTLDGSGNGTVLFQATGDNVRITNLFGRCSSSTKQAVATIYQGYIGVNYQLDNSNSGSTGFKASGNIDLHDGEVVYVQWVGGDAGALATATFTGYTIPFDQLTATSFAVDDNFAAGDGTIIYPALKSPNYVPGVSGWIINRDGSTEFQNVVVRGTFEADGPGGTYVKGYVTTIATPSGTATLPVIDFQAPDLNDGPGSIYAYTDTPYSLLGLNSPTFSTDQPAELLLRSSTTGDSSTAITANTTFFLATNVILAGPDQGDVGRGMIAYAGDTGNSAAIGATETAVLTTGTTTFRAGRAYRVCLAGRLITSVASSSPFINIKKTNVAGASLYTVGRYPNLGTGEYAIMNPDMTYTVGASNVSATICLTLTGSASFTVAQQGRRWMAIYDVGPATNYPDAVVLV